MTTVTTPETLQHPALHHLQLVWVEGKKDFMIGSRDDEDSQPIHPVDVSGFYMAIFPVTQALWTAVTGQNPSYFKGSRRPVEQVSWNDIREPGGFLDQLNYRPEVKNWLTGLEKKNLQFRLPAEAEWEYAARGGINDLDYEYADSGDIDEVAWYDENGLEGTRPVGLKAPNALGLYDMSGNIWEWCEDDWHDNYKGAPKTSAAWVDDPRGGYRLLRGGGWYNVAIGCRPACRSHDQPGNRDHGCGLRLVLAPSSVERGANGR